MFEELKMKVRPKMVVVNRELADMKSIFKDYNDKNQEDGRPVFIKTLEFYLNELKFDSDKVMGGLDEEIKSLKREMEQMKDLNLDKMESWTKSISFSKEQI